MDDLAQARERMVVEQLERRGIRDCRVLAAMRMVERERFVPVEYAAQAYNDEPLPIGAEQTISQPYMVALMSEVAQLTGVERVLEIGTGSGYAAAVLARLAATVYSVECLPALYERARARLEAMEITNVHLSCRDGSEGWPEQAPFDAILVTAAMPGIARPLLDQLQPDGRLVAPIGEDDLQTLVRISRRDDAWHEEYFGECRFVKMTGRHGFKEP
ncbi:MAG TPA: protein-L-isoaspartate(D-aspartate) O-methyltransferase [Candidatus Binataceae bacterium]|nr:protein-L-isoaspartate(D-aspartate) O-methyltransferase [Candidatus Binataceae bacterium]